MSKNGSTEKKAPKVRTLFLSVVVAFLVLALPLFLFVFSLVGASRQTMTRQYNDAIQLQLTNYFASLEGAIERINARNVELLNDVDVLYLKNEYITQIDYPIVKSINSLGSKLVAATSDLSNIEELAVYLFSLDRYLQVTDVVYYSEIDHAALDAFTAESTTKGGLTYYRDGLYWATYPPGVYNEEYPLLILSKISSSEIISSISGYNLFDRSISCILFHDFDMILFDEGHEGEIDRAELYAFMEGGNDVKEVRHNNTEYLLFSCPSEYLNATYVQLLPKQDAFADFQLFYRWLAAFCILILVATAAYVVSMHYVVRKPMKLLLSAIEDVREEKFNTAIYRDRRDEFSIIFDSFNSMVARISTLIEEVYIQKILSQKAELRQLQAQINPHFLSNSFFLLKRRIVYNDMEEAKLFCEMLGEYFRYASINYMDYATLREEVEYARIYVQIQQRRFIERLIVDFAPLPVECEKLGVPRLILQPVLENAFKYGLEEKEFDGLLRVRFYPEKDSLQIVVEDNGDCFGAEDENYKRLESLFDETQQSADVSGLLNIHKRLQLFTSDEQSGIACSVSELGGLKVTITIKY